MAPRPEIHLILHNVRSAQNVGAIFRVADAVGASKIYLTGYTPLPRDRFGRSNRAVAKTALGAENYVTWEVCKSLKILISKLKAKSLPVRLASLKLRRSGQAGYELVALEQSSRSVDYRKIKIARPTAIIVGNEVRGLSPRILKQCDAIAEIPMRGRKESLNVAVACGIFLFQISR